MLLDVVWFVFVARVSYLREAVDGDILQGDCLMEEGGVVGDQVRHVVALMRAEFEEHAVAVRVHSEAKRPQVDTETGNYNII